MHTSSGYLVSGVIDVGLPPSSLCALFSSHVNVAFAQAQQLYCQVCCRATQLHWVLGEFHLKMDARGTWSVVRHGTSGALKSRTAEVSSFSTDRPFVKK